MYLKIQTERSHYFELTDSGHNHTVPELSFTLTYFGLPVVDSDMLFSFA